MSVKLMKEEIGMFTDFHEGLHKTTDINDNFGSIFAHDFCKSTWYATAYNKLSSSINGDEIVYLVNHSYHFLLSTYMRFLLPAVKVKDIYKDVVEIAWCHNVGLNIVNIAQFKENDDVFQTLDNVNMDIFYQFCQKGGAGMREAHNVGVGNVPIVENFASELVPYQINVKHPWFYSYSTSTAFPIFYKNTQLRAQHNYKMRLKIYELLRMRRLVDGVWEPVLPSEYGEYLETDPTLNISTPEMYGHYAYCTDVELDHYKNCSGLERHIYIRDFQTCEEENCKKYKTTASAPMSSSNPCLAFFWVAQNLDAVKYNNYSNYTTNSQDLHRGWDPITHSTMKYGNEALFDKLPSDHFSIAMAQNHFTSAPEFRGFHAYSYAYDCMCQDADIAVLLEGRAATLQCLLGNNSIFGPDNQPSPEFKLISKLMVLRKFTIVGDKDTPFRYELD